MNNFNYQVLPEKKQSNQNALEALLNDKTYHIEFNGHLTNHSKHAVIALAGLGVSDQKIREYYKNHAEETAYGFGLEYAKPSRYKINEDNWKEYIGKRTSFSSYCDFFDDQENKLGIDELLNRYLPSLLPGWAGAFTHATIHLGWALSVKNRCMIIEGLAYMAFSYVSCYPERMRTDFSLPNKDRSPAESLLRIANEWDENGEEIKQWISEVLSEENAKNLQNIHPELKRSGLQYRIARMLAGGHTLMYENPGWLKEKDTSKLWEELYFAVCLLYLSDPGDFVLLHLVTSLYAMEKIAEHLPIDQKRKVIECYWVGMLGIIFSGGEYPKLSKISALNAIYESANDSLETAIAKDWEHIIARAVEEEEEHNPKLVYVLRRVWEASKGKTIYRAAAAQFTSTPDLPKSFEEEPMDELEVENYLKGNDPRDNTIQNKNVTLLPQTNLLRSYHTIIRDRNASRNDFIFYSGKIIDQLITESINLIPFKNKTALTPVGEQYNGLDIPENICGVSIVRAGESMEVGLRNILRSSKIGKILIQRDKITKLPKLYYTKLPQDIADSHVLLLDPMLATGGTALAAIQVLIDQGVKESNIIFVSLLSVAPGLNAIWNKYPKVKVVTSAIEERLNENAYMIPGIGDFGDRYFGTD